ncbi:hypothetical protein M5K25_010902 [Dendrobium thyrsiflorum]|uniref:Uncharacterized protein n=1 Tax=Dendrobium thyrsiflorum TaxID=117978 RepID=A0ABD0V231_DENTH
MYCSPRLRPPVIAIIRPARARTDLPPVCRKKIAHFCVRRRLMLLNVIEFVIYSDNQISSKKLSEVRLLFEGPISTTWRKCCNDLSRSHVKAATPVLFFL